VYRLATRKKQNALISMYRIVDGAAIDPSKPNLARRPSYLWGLIGAPIRLAAQARETRDIAVPQLIARAD
jgi:hypothetical protein